MKGALFSYIPPNCAHDPYMDPWDPRRKTGHIEAKGLPHFKTAVSKKPVSMGVMHKGEYTAPTLVFSNNKERQEKMLTKEGFKYTSPPKKTAKGQGLHYGTFNEKPYEHVTQNKAPKKTAEKVKAYEPRNFYTNSASKDFNDVDYIPDDYGAIEKAKKEFFQSKGTVKTPFLVPTKEKSLSKPLSDMLFSPIKRSQSLPVHPTTNAQRPMSANNIRSNSTSAPTLSRSASTSSRVNHKESFRPFSATIRRKSVIPGTFSQHEYVSDPYDDKTKKYATLSSRAKPVALQNAEEKKMMQGGAWLPSSIPKTLPVRPILTAKR
mmetsp:Transcript_15248/g.22932  ORF Transcript_15248/g.22932 Transcript_15248/m.22932 type:complete len:320 (+) Transcript_15248:190-1149(+)|eukprot:CAMPEP_0185020660 /NCGR_PEP_ID=MMETSP1103-20130426/3282_1 /TAXON_ID=36769 /ORGANISM="Paraphysomonas bandaiensis, Strain Caron Lab Isolate" /LENGTH=319 /DNA_ID=CAMNT_0027551689 /DNA_START=353 /DNA_END=1312 /DNA_ORIENTATION=-